MFWGPFGFNGKSELAEISTRLNSEGYTDILQEALLPDAGRIGGRGWIFQQDNARIHTSALTKNFLSQKGVTLLDWPAKSPDLNPIENLWGIVARDVMARESSTTQKRSS